jgi:hypothetical protein
LKRKRSQTSAVAMQLRLLVLCLVLTIVWTQVAEAVGFFRQNWNLVISRCEIKKQKSSFFCKIEIWIIIIVIFLEEQGNFR